MAGFNHIKRCLELADRDIAFAMEDRLVCKALLDRLAIISKPGDGGPKILLIFARMASQACDWIDGDLRIEIAGAEDACVFEVLTDLGAGMRERVFASLRFNIPLDELIRAVERVPHMIEPLTIAVKTSKKVVLSATEGVRKSTMPPPMVEIDRESLFEQDMRPPGIPSFVASVPPSYAAPSTPPTVMPAAQKTPPPARMPDPSKTPEPARMPEPGGALSRSKIQIVKKPDAAPTSVKMPIVVKSPNAPTAANAAGPSRAPSIAKMPVVVKAASPNPSAPKVIAAPKAAPAPAPAAPVAAAQTKGKSIRPSSPSQVGKSQRPKAPSKPPRTSLSEPPDEETIDTGWDED